MIKVVVSGAAGKMGSESCEAVKADGDLVLVGMADHKVEALEPTSGESEVVTGYSLKDVLGRAKADVVVDFTHGSAVLEHVEAAAEHGAHMVIGTTGVGADDLRKIEQLAESGRLNVLLAPNFAIGAVLMMRFAEEAARFAQRAEIVELHHDAKKDAPSGTALLTAERMARRLKADPLVVEEKVAGCRGGDFQGIGLHSVRLPGLVAHQEVILGFPGQTLTIRHDSLDRKSFMPGVIMAIKAIGSRPGLTIGLDPLLFQG